MEVTDLDRNSTTPVASRDADLTVRLATADEADGKSLRPLASLGGKTPPYGPVMLAEVGGEPVAAVGLADGDVIGHPLRSSAAIVGVLHLHRLEARLIGSIWGA